MRKAIKLSDGQQVTAHIEKLGPALAEIVDIAVFNLHKGRIMLVFPSGAKINDQSGLLEGNYQDGRRLAVFKDMTDVRSKGISLRKAIKEWIRLVDK